MNIVVTSKEAILRASREFVAANGVQALNIRAIAKLCRISAGTIYNYFPSKRDLVSETIQSIWNYIFKIESDYDRIESFPKYVHCVYQKALARVAEYPGFFTAYSLAFSATVESDGALYIMEDYFTFIETGLLGAIKADPDVKLDAFSKELTRMDFVHFVFMNMLSLLVQQNDSCSTLLEIIKRTIY